MVYNAMSLLFITGQQTKESQKIYALKAVLRKQNRKAFSQSKVHKPVVFMNDRVLKTTFALVKHLLHNENKKDTSAWRSDEPLVKATVLKLGWYPQAHNFYRCFHGQMGSFLSSMDDGANEWTAAQEKIYWFQKKISFFPFF